MFCSLEDFIQAYPKYLPCQAQNLDAFPLGRLEGGSLEEWESGTQINTDSNTGVVKKEDWKDSSKTVANGQ